MTSHYQTVLDAIDQGMKFSFNLYGIRPFTPQGRLVHTIDAKQLGGIGWVLQEFVKKAIYNPDLLISFEPTPEGINVYYE